LHFISCDYVKPTFLFYLWENLWDSLRIFINGPF